MFDTSLTPSNEFAIIQFSEFNTISNHEYPSIIQTITVSTVTTLPIEFEAFVGTYMRG